MSLLDGILSQFGGHTLDSLGARVGLTPEQVQEALGALHQNAAVPGDTATQAAQQTGLPTDALQQILAHVGGEGGLAQIMGQLGGAQGGGGGLGGLIGGFLGGGRENG